MTIHQIDYSLILSKINKINVIIPKNNAIANVILEDNMNKDALLSRVLLDPNTKPHIAVNMAKLTLFPTSLFVDNTADALLKSFLST